MNTRKTPTLLLLCPWLVGLSFAPPGPPPIPSMSQHLVGRYTRKQSEGDRVALALADLLGPAFG